jgi:hypothetical protein
VGHSDVGLKYLAISNIRHSYFTPYLNFSSTFVYWFPMVRQVLWMKTGDLACHLGLKRKLFFHFRKKRKFKKWASLREILFRGNFSCKSFRLRVSFLQKVITKIGYLFVLKHYPNSTIQLGTSTIKRLSHLLWNKTRIFSPNYQIILHSFSHLILSITRILLVHWFPSTSKLRMPLGIRMFHGTFSYRVNFCYFHNFK